MKKKILSIFASLTMLMNVVYPGIAMADKENLSEVAAIQEVHEYSHKKENNALEISKESETNPTNNVEETDSKNAVATEHEDLSTGEIPVITETETGIGEVELEDKTQPEEQSEIQSEVQPETQAVVHPLETLLDENPPANTEPTQIEGVYQIATNEELSWFAANGESSSAILTADLNIGNADFLPMFSSGFKGIFDGGGKTIKYTLEATSNLQGLFRTVSKEGTIKNLNTAGEITFNISRKRDYFGGIAARNQGLIENSTNNVHISDTNFANYAGGITGNNEGTIRNSTNNGEINVTSFAGGLAGVNTGGSIYDSYNNANITAKGVVGIAGGIVGSLTNVTSDDQMEIFNSTNAGNITGGESGTAGGIVGNEALKTLNYGATLKITIDKCSNTGELKAGTTEQIVGKIKDGNEKVIEIIEKEQPPVVKENPSIKEAKEKLTLVTLQKEYSEADNLYNIKEDKSNETLPSTYSATGVQIKWESSNPEIAKIKESFGVSFLNIYLPEKGGNVEITLTATISKDGQSDTKEFKLIVWSKENLKPEGMKDGPYVEKVVGDLNENGFHLRPEYGKDINVINLLKTKLDALGYDDINITISKVKNPEDETAEINNEGEVRYFYDDPSKSRGLWFAQIPVTFELSRGQASGKYTTNAIVYWDVAKVEKYINDEILANVQVTSETDKDIELPKYIGGKAGKTWVEISWTSSDDKTILISDENQRGNADALYNPYVGKVLLSDTDKDVILTATAKFNRTNDVTGSEKLISVSKVYPVKVNKMDEGSWGAIQKQMQKELDEKYDLNKLKDLVTREKLDLSNVRNDIHFLIPRETGIPNYSNYKFNLSSSDDNVIVVPDIANAARGFVYRPLPGEPEKTVTLSVIMTSKENPNLVATKSFEVKVQPLAQAEIDDALRLMSLTKEHYFDGINNGKYADKNSVNGRLKSFNEAVFNDAKDGVNWIYHYDNEKGNGVRPDALDGWEDQEAWRTFRSSNPNIIEHESLNYGTQPKTDTFVRINSVLTHEVLGKYWSKFSGNPSYSIFETLYKQPVEVYVLVEGKETKTKEYEKLPTEERNEILNKLEESARTNINKPLDIHFELSARDFSGINVGISTPAGSTAFEVFRKALADAGFTFASEGSYVKSITSSDGTSLAELDRGKNSGWMYKVNGVFPNVYMNAYNLEDGDKIEVLYTEDYKKEPGVSSSFGGGGGTPTAEEKKKTEIAKPEMTKVVESVATNEANFIDVQAKDWYYDAVRYVTEKGIMVGMGENKFSPNAPTTRAMFVSVLHKYEKQPDATTKNMFKDVKEGAWYTNAISWASENGIISGYNKDLFGPNDNISREELAALLMRYAEYKGVKNSLQSDLSKYKDANKISDWAVSSMKWANANNIISGKSDTVLDPKANASRAEIASMMMKFTENLL